MRFVLTCFSEGEINNFSEGEINNFSSSFNPSLLLTLLVFEKLAATSANLRTKFLPLT